MPKTMKDAVIDMVQRMPSNAMLIDIMAELYFRRKVEAGLKELDEGKGVPHERAKEKLQKWLS